MIINFEYEGQPVTIDVRFIPKQKETLEQEGIPAHIEIWSCSRDGMDEEFLMSIAKEYEKNFENF